MNEQELISHLKNRFEKPTNLVSSWMGEDCEVLEIGDPERYLLVSVDTSSERVDFPQNAPPFEIGYFSAALSLADIAACGGEPLGISVSCSIPPHFREKVTEVYEGIEQAANDGNTCIIGGDSNSAGEFSLSVVSIGLVKKEQVLFRRKASPGDLVAVTGELDHFNFGYYQYDVQGLAIVDFQRMLRQKPPIKAGQVLSSLGVVTSCIDLPDGLIKGLSDNMPANLGFLINDRAIPVNYYKRHAQGVAFRPKYVLASQPAGDIQLLFTVPPEFAVVTEEAFRKENLSLYWIGKVVANPGIKINLGSSLVTPVTEGFIHRFEGFELFP